MFYASSIRDVEETEAVELIAINFSLSKFHPSSTAAC
jgi:hypothetical protein